MQACGQERLNPALDRVFFNTDGSSQELFVFHICVFSFTISICSRPLVPSHSYLSASPERVTEMIILTQHHPPVLNLP